RAGLIPVFTLPAHRKTEIAHFVDNAEAAALVVGEAPDGFDYVAMAREVQAEWPRLRHIVAVGGAGRDGEGCVAFDGFGSEAAPPPDADVDASDVAFMQISGGSTGLPKL